MTEQTTNQEIGEPLSWIRITGISFALASHVALGLTLLVPVTTADEVEEPAAAAAAAAGTTERDQKNN